jgi:hypothetical protein
MDGRKGGILALLTEALVLMRRTGNYQYPPDSKGVKKLTARLRSWQASCEEVDGLSSFGESFRRPHS